MRRRVADRQARRPASALNVRRWTSPVRIRALGASSSSATTLLRNVKSTLMMYFSGDHGEIYLIDKVSIKSYVRLVNGISS